MEIALDTCAEVDLIGVEFAKQRRLKPYIKDYPRLWQSAGDVRHQAMGAYWVTWQMTDHRGVTRTHRRPFLAVEMAEDDAPLLLGERTLGEIGVNIALRPREAGGNRWQFHLPEGDDVRRLIKVESAKAFRKRLMKGPKVYALVEINALLSQKGKDGGTELPKCLKKYVDVFSSQNAEKLAPNREGIDLAIKV